MTNTQPLREFTLRGVVLGALITLAFTAANVYLGLKVGLTFASAIPAAVISMALLYRFKDSNILENNMVQTQASAAGTLSSVIFVLPGLLMLGLWSGFPFWQTALLCAAGGTLGVLFTVPLRRVMVVQSPHLPYPEGLAAAEVLRVGDAQRHQEEDAPSSSGLRELAWGTGLAALFGLFGSGFRVLGDAVNVWIPAGSVAFRFAAGFSPALLAAGYLMGAAAGAAVLLGLVLCWGLVVPWLTAQATPEAGQAVSALALQLWSGKARFLGAGVIGVAALWTVATLARPILQAMRNQPARRADAPAASDETDRDMPRRWMLLIGLAALGVLFAVVDYFIAQHMPGLSAAARHGLSALCVVFAAVFGFLVAAACGYMAGLVGSSASPISGIGIIATILMGLSLLALHALAPAYADSVSGQLGVALVLFMVSSVLAMAAISNDNLQDLKTGYLVGATPWRQQAVLIIGVLVGALVIPPVLDLLYNAYGFAGAMPREGMDAAQALAALQATLMTQIANGIFTGGLDWTMLGLGMALGVLVILADVALRRAGKGALPPLAVGLGIYLPPTIGMTLALGALLGWLVQRAIQRHGARHGKAWIDTASERGLLLASGLIVGESLTGLLIAALIGFSGRDAPLALVEQGFTPAMWLGMGCFAALFAFFYRRVLRK
ncbi:OPT family oligopeptide transporter [Comamonas endophytica]|uniref:Oligopeptide transporter, OPT family n=1 Tax=Comamonas endophytica TaxID=2949090 RepID=A0ABY6GGA4_9BURK|nr:MULTISPECIES: oligopeptide transporter, OPT family [unclassified Acidovorax]MCD2513292.1 oligopeptide transporter, OPT family [Acidovorax sp. D4N7]UYG53365.1 oligopeptide transporter, OPT family [Acidovorax sp. 5MLIR]